MFRRSLYGLYPYKSSMIGLESLADPSSDWDILETIGKGTYGKVYKVISKKDGSQAAVKVLDPINVSHYWAFWDFIQLWHLCSVYCNSILFLMWAHGNCYFHELYSAFLLRVLNLHFYRLDPIDSKGGSVTLQFRNESEKCAKNVLWIYVTFSCALYSQMNLF